MAKQYLIRLDDACPTMDHGKWQIIEDILDEFSIKPMVGIIPHNEDSQCIIDKVDDGFWNKCLKWQDKGWAIAMHGYNHVYTFQNGLKGLNPMWKRSEFAGLSYVLDCKKVRDGYRLMSDMGLKPEYFFAPSHTFDEVTLDALRDCTPIRKISDTIATKPYKHKDFVVIPQIGGHCVDMKFPGVWTFCLHPNVMNTESFDNLECFLKKHNNEFISFDEIDYDNVGNKSFVSKMLTFIYFAQRRLRGIK